MWVRAENLCKRRFVVTIFKRQFFLILFPPSVLLSMKSTLLKFPACGLWLRRWIYLLPSFSLMCLSHIWFLRSDGVCTLTYLLHASLCHLNCNSILSGSADVLSEKAALWLFTFLDMYFLLEFLLASHPHYPFNSLMFLRKWF